MALYLAREITQVKESIPWVRCASGNVFLRVPKESHKPQSSHIYIPHFFLHKPNFVLHKCWTWGEGTPFCDFFSLAKSHLKRRSNLVGDWGGVKSNTPSMFLFGNSVNIWIVLTIKLNNTKKTLNRRTNCMMVFAASSNSFSKICNDLFLVPTFSKA